MRTAAGTRHFLGGVLLIALWVLFEPSPVQATSTSDYEAARALASRARAQLDARRPEPAARLFELAHERAPHPLWLTAAGEAWLEALQAAPAVQRLEEALADPALSGTAREHTVERLALARRVAPLIAAARANGISPDEAFRAWREAIAVSNLGRCVLEAAQAAERARLFKEAESLFALAAERDDLAPEERRVARDKLLELRERDLLARVRTPATSNDSGWVVVVSGAAVLTGGVVAFLVGEEQRGRVRSAMADDGALSTRMSRAEAQSLERSANTWSTIGWVAAGLGVVAVTVGVVVLETQPVPRGAVLTAKVVW